MWPVRISCLIHHRRHFGSLELTWACLLYLSHKSPKCLASSSWVWTLFASYRNYNSSHAPHHSVQCICIWAFIDRTACDCCFYYGCCCCRCQHRSSLIVVIISLQCVISTTFSKSSLRSENFDQKTSRWLFCSSLALSPCCTKQQRKTTPNRITRSQSKWFRSIVTVSFSFFELRLSSLPFAFMIW